MAYKKYPVPTPTANAKKFSTTNPSTMASTTSPREWIIATSTLYYCCSVPAHTETITILSLTTGTVMYVYSLHVHCKVSIYPGNSCITGFPHFWKSQEITFFWKIREFSGDLLFTLGKSGEFFWLWKVSVLSI